METVNFNSPKTGLNWRLTLKIGFIGAITILLLIPKLMIISLIDERSKTAETAKNEVMEKWSYAQTLRGPILTIPSRELVFNDAEKKYSEVIQTCYFLPSDLKIEGTLQPQERHRSIYKVVVYDSEITLSGTFESPDPAILQVKPEDLFWEKAELSLAISDLRGIANLVEMDWNGEKLTFSPGMDKELIGANGITLPMNLKPGMGFPAKFSCRLHLKGSHSILFAPVGKQTTVHLASAWNDPGFTGSFIPTSHVINAQGFQADWNVLHFNRNFPQSWKGDKFNLSASDFGVELITVADHYQKNTRSAKYGILVILLIFLSFFLNEMITGTRIHPIQYALVGVAILIFYLLLLSVSEQTGFNTAYFLSSASVLLLVFAYSRTFVKKWVSSLGLTMILAFSFAFIFVLLQMETYALLAGSIGLFVILALTMFFTRKINWYNEQ